MSAKQYGVAVLCAAMLVGANVAPMSAAAQTTDTSNQAALLAQIESLMKLIADLQKQISGARSELEEIIKAGLEEGMQDDDIRKVQELLATDPTIYPEGRVTGFFGPMTREAIKRFQERHDLEVTGKLDEATRDLIKEFRKERQNGNLPPGLLKSQEARQRVMDRLQAKWGEKCDLSQPGRGKNCEKPWKDKDNVEDEDESEDEDDDSASTTKEVTRKDANRAIADAQKAIAELQEEIDEATEEEEVAEGAIEDAQDALEAAQTELRAARRALTSNDFETALEKAEAVEEATEDALDELKGDAEDDEDDDSDEDEDEDEDEEADEDDN